jgi:hypothetical protein
MCDTSPLKNWLYAIAAAILAAIASIVMAAILNGSFWLAWTSPVAMLAAAAASFLGATFCNSALDALEVLCRCTGDRCFGQCNNLRNILRAAAGVLGIQGTACLGAAAAAWIPYVGQPVMWIIIGALTIQFALIISAIAFMARMDECATRGVPGPGREPGSGPVPS